MPNRYDICWTREGPSIQLHFCREWDGDGGCYGTREDHGCSWDEAVEVVANWHEEKAVSWRNLDEDEWNG